MTDYARDCDPLRRRGPGAPVLFNADRVLKKELVSDDGTAANSYDKRGPESLRRRGRTSEKAGRSRYDFSR